MSTVHPATSPTTRPDIACSRTISVVISPTADGSFPGGAPVVDLAPTSYSTRDSSAIYSVIMFPTFIYGASSTGNHTVYVIETYNAYGVGCELCFFDRS